MAPIFLAHSPKTTHRGKGKGKTGLIAQIQAHKPRQLPKKGHARKKPSKASQSLSLSAPSNPQATLSGLPAVSKTSLQALDWNSL